MVHQDKSKRGKNTSTVTAVHDFYRYYDTSHNVEIGMRQVHSFDTERMLISIISKSGRSKLCGFKKDGDEDKFSKRIRREHDRHVRQLVTRTGRARVKLSLTQSLNSIGDNGDVVRVAEEEPVEHSISWDDHFS